MRSTSAGTEPTSSATAAAALLGIKIVHTVVWAFFASSIAAIPVLAFANRLTLAWILIGIVLVEVIVLACNGWTCPLTGVAARYTRERRDNFDIFLPERLARHNKAIFGTIYVCGVVVTLVRWALG